MNRAAVSHSISDFFNRLACALVADYQLLEQVCIDLDEYIENLEESFDSLDSYTLNELCKISSYRFHNRNFIIEKVELSGLFVRIENTIMSHARFLEEHGMTPEYLIKWRLDALY
ncbi:hypothetical protein [Vibrio parahaemolyticus]|uniref:hypothetical protein n=1 Tax=Vibrio parahaemolyticus TaxID=670 RepID=UPI0010AB11E9|nr:hypothetical protein [Vibrio parahaemolyticus]THE62362.1 hypothetical protein E4P16_00125 [Vibrio parahaemolyticus]